MSIAEKIQVISENQQRVYDAGIAVGVEEGKQEQYDLFWDGVQNKGNRKGYQYGFSYWSDDIFFPKYDIKVTTAVSMFVSCTVKDLTQRLLDCGVVLDTSGVQNFTSALAYMPYVTRIPVIDASSATTLYRTFYNDKGLIEIEKIILPDNTDLTFSETFDNCSALEEIRFEGVIGNSMWLHHSPKLSKASITNIIGCLSNTAEKKTINLSSAAVKKAFQTSENANDGDKSAEWTALVATKPNWTISLI